MEVIARLSNILKPPPSPRPFPRRRRRRRPFCAVTLSKKKCCVCTFSWCACVQDARVGAGGGDRGLRFEQRGPERSAAPLHARTVNKWGLLLSSPRLQKPRRTWLRIRKFHFIRYRIASLANVRPIRRLEEEEQQGHPPFG